MKRLLLASLLALGGSAIAEVKYDLVPNWLTPPPGKETIGNCHGEIGVDSSGKVYVSVWESSHAGIQVYGPDGKFIKALELPRSLHGFVIRKVDGHEYLFGAVLGAPKTATEPAEPGEHVIKCELDGTIVMDIPKTAFPEEQAKAGLRLTNCDVASNGDIYVVDGYGKSWIFVFDSTGKFKKVFGGPDQPYGFKNTHKIFIDKRFSPERVLCLDRGNKRMLHTDLDGKILGVIAEDMRNPSSASFHGDLVCIAEIAGRVSVWDKEGKMVAECGTNPKTTNTPKIQPTDWQTGIVTSPHGITFDNDGNILECEWNQWGRVLRWNVKK